MPRLIPRPSGYCRCPAKTGCSSHDDLEFRSSAEAALLARGYAVRSFSTALAAMLGLDEPQLVDLLITRVRFPPGASNGMALARSARLKHKDVKILFVAAPEFQVEAEEIGTYLAAPATIPDLLEAVQKVLA
jgi:DNA-binding response OmpR family regulator